MTMAQEDAALERAAQEPIGPDALDYLESESAQMILGSAEADWRAELAKTYRTPEARAQELEWRMMTLRETLIADRPDRYLDQAELANRYRQFPREELTPEQRKAVEAIDGPEDSFWAASSDIGVVVIDE